jgi:hypothetical protein
MESLPVSTPHFDSSCTSYLPFVTKQPPHTTSQTAPRHLMQWLPESAIMTECSWVKEQLSRSTLLGVCSRARAPSPEMREGEQDVIAKRNSGNIHIGEVKKYT